MNGVHSTVSMVVWSSRSERVLEFSPCEFCDREQFWNASDFLVLDYSLLASRLYWVRSKPLVRSDLNLATNIMTYTLILAHNLNISSHSLTHNLSVNTAICLQHLLTAFQMAAFGKLLYNLFTNSPNWPNEEQWTGKFRIIKGSWIFASQCCLDSKQNLNFKMTFRMLWNN